MPLTVDVVIPCLNEELALPVSIRRLHDVMSTTLAHCQWNIVIADNGSTDGTQAESQALSAEFPAVRYLRLEQRGRGRALRRSWTESAADIMAYMDVDLSTNLTHLRPMIDAIARDNYDIAIGSRLLPDSHVVGRTLKRETTSRGYSLLFRLMFFTSFRDAQCGFKAISRRAADDLAPLVEDNGWFFDSELLILAQKCGYRIRELPVQWTDDPDSRVRILRLRGKTSKACCASSSAASARRADNSAPPEGCSRSPTTGQKMAGDTGFEPVIPDPESGVLPLD